MWQQQLQGVKMGYLQHFTCKIESSKLSTEVDMESCMGSCDALAIILSVQASQLPEQAWYTHSSICAALPNLCREDDTLAHQTLQA